MRHFEWAKLIKNAKNGQFSKFLKPEACGQTQLPERSTSIRQKLAENAKIEIFNRDAKSDFNQHYPTGRF